MRKGILLLAAASLLLAIDPEARNVKTVYILRMTSGLDQYLASELTKEGVYGVTTDPQKADALLTDAVGDGFEKKFRELYPPPPDPAKKEEKKDEKEEPGLKGSAVQRVGSSSWSRGRGSIFLVDRKSRGVLWSMNRQPKNSGAKEMVDQARKIVVQLKKDLGLVPAK